MSARPLLRILFPAVLRQVPQRRLVLNSLRAWHIVSFSLLVGGIFFHQDIARLWLWLGFTIASGLALFALDLYSSFFVLFEWRGSAILIKILLLLSIPLLDYHQQVMLLIFIIVFSSFVSHSTRRLRHKCLMPRAFQQKFAPDFAATKKHDR